MTDRRSYDTPAAAVAAIFGVALLALGLPFAIAHFPAEDGPGTFNVLWSEAAVGAQSVTVTEGQTQSVQVQAGNVLTSHVRLVPGDCSDNPNSPLASAAVLRYRLVRRAAAGEEVLKEGTVTCATKGNAQFTLDRTNHPDVGQVEAESRDAAANRVWSGAPANETATYSLEIAASRPAGPGGPLPNPVTPTLSATFAVEVDHWVAAIVPAETEVPVR